MANKIALDHEKVERVEIMSALYQMLLLAAVSCIPAEKEEFKISAKLYDMNKEKKRIETNTKRFR